MRSTPQRAESLKLIKIRPDRSIKPLVARNFDWLPNGPIQRYFQDAIREDFLATEFNQAAEKLLFLTGAFSAETSQQLMTRMEKLADDFKELNEQDSNLPLGTRVGGSMVIAYRPWTMRGLEELRR